MLIRHKMRWAIRFNANSVGDNNLGPLKEIALLSAVASNEDYRTYMLELQAVQKTLAFELQPEQKTLSYFSMLCYTMIQK